MLSTCSDLRDGQGRDAIKVGCITQEAGSTRRGDHVLQTDGRGRRRGCKPSKLPNGQPCQYAHYCHGQSVDLAAQAYYTLAIHEKERQRYQQALEYVTKLIKLDSAVSA